MVGAGFLAETRARCYQRLWGVDGEIVAVASRTRDKARAYADRHGVGKVCGELDELLADDRVDVVDLCVPNLLHRSMTEAAAAAGKHVICTKPLAAYVGQDLGDDPPADAVSAVARGAMATVAVDDARAMVDATERAGVRLMYGENWVYAPSIVRAAGLLAASKGVILEMRGWECHSGSHSPYSKTWKNAGGGALIRLAAHPIGAMLHLKREEGLRMRGRPTRPVGVTADVADLTRVSGLDAGNTEIATGWEDVESWGTVIVTFEDGSRGVAHGGDHLLGGMESRLDVVSSDSHLKCRLSPNDLLGAYAPTPDTFGDAYIMEKSSTAAGWSTPIPEEDWSSGHAAMCQDFIRAVAEEQAPLADGELGLEVTKVIYHAYIAAAEGRRVELPA